MAYFVIVGASQSHVPFIEAGKKLGYSVAVLDRDTSSPGALRADEFFPVSTHDLDSIRQVCKYLKKKGGLKGIMTYSAYKQPLINVSKLCSEYRLASFSPESVLLTIDKSLMKKRFVEAGILTPEYAVVNNLIDAREIFRTYSCPCIIKPSLGSQGSAGVSIVRHLCEVDNAFSEALKHSQDDSALLERYCRGREFSVDGFVVDRQPTILALLDKYNLGPEFNFTISGFSAGPISDEDQHLKDHIETIRKVACSAVHAMGINNSLFSVDVLLTDTETLVLECGVLLDAKVDRLLYHSGCDIYDLFCRMATKDKLFPNAPRLHQGWALKFMFAPDEGNLLICEPSDFSYNTLNSEGPVVEWERSNGDSVRPPKSISDTVGWVVAGGGDRSKAFNNALHFSKNNLFTSAKEI